MLKRVIVLAVILGAGLSLFAISGTAQDTPPPPEPVESMQSVGVSDEVDGEAGLKKQNWFVRIMDQGGPVMYALLFCSILVVAVIVERSLSLRTSRFYSEAMVDDLKAGLLAKDLAAIGAVGKKFDGQALGRIVQQSVEEIGEFGVPFEQAVEDCSERELRGIHRFIKLLQSIGAIAPLLGLLGTVLGMIMAFEAIADAAKLQELDKGVVAAGISQALITTATGLIIAIPALVGHGFFTSRIDNIISDIEEMLGDMVKLFRKAGK